jgi:hypothetical protein
MKPSVLRIERMLAEVEAKLVPPPRKCLCVIIHDRGEGADAKEKMLAGAQEKALAEHVARHPEDAGRTVNDFKWIVHEFVHTPLGSQTSFPSALPVKGNGNGYDRHS